MEGILGQGRVKVFKRGAKGKEKNNVFSTLFFYIVFAFHSILSLSIIKMTFYIFI